MHSINLHAILRPKEKTCMLNTYSHKMSYTVIAHNLQTVSRRLLISPLTASKLYNWSISCSASGTPDVRCDATTQIYDPFNAIANSCNYEKECYRGSPEK